MARARITGLRAPGVGHRAHRRRPRRPAPAARGRAARRRAGRRAAPAARRATRCATSASRRRRGRRDAGRWPRTRPSSSRSTTRSSPAVVDPRAATDASRPAGAAPAATSTARSPPPRTSCARTTRSRAWSPRRSSRAARLAAGDARAAHAVVLGAGHAPPARRPRARPRAPGGHAAGRAARRRRRVRLQGHARAGGRGGGRGGAAPRPPGQVGRGPLRELPRRATRAAACAAAVELALDADGRMLALRARASSPTSAPTCCRAPPIPPHTTAMLLRGCYDIPAVEVARHRRAHGQGPDRALPRRRAGPEATLPDRAHDRPGRARAGARPDRAAPAQPGARASRTRTALGWTYDSGDYERCLDRALELLGPSAGADGDGCRPRRRALRRARRRPVGGRRGRRVDADGAWSSAAARPRTARATRRCSPRSPPTGSASSSATSSCASATAAVVPRGIGDVRLAARWRWAARPSRWPPRQLRERCRALAARGWTPRTSRRCRAASDAGRPAGHAARARGRLRRRPGGVRALRLRPGVLLRRLRGDVAVDPETGASTSCASSRSTTPGGSSTRCSPRAR